MPTGYPKSGTNTGWFKKGNHNGLGIKKNYTVWNKNKKGSQIAWNKGLTANDPRVAKYVEKMKGVPKSEGLKKKWSETRLRGIKEGRIKSWNKGQKQSEEHRQKNIKRHLGQKSWNKGLNRLTDKRIEKYIRRGEQHSGWKGGKKTENEKIRQSLEIKIWRDSVFIVYKYTCQKCNIHSGCGRTIELRAHHIQNFSQYPELRLVVANGIVFCKDCHLEFHKKYGFRNNTKEQVDEFLLDKKSIAW